MAIRDQYIVTLLNGKTTSVSATRQGGGVTLDDTDGDTYIIRENTKSGVLVSELRVARAVVETIEYKPGG